MTPEDFGKSLGDTAAAMLRSLVESPKKEDPISDKALMAMFHGAVKTWQRKAYKRRYVYLVFAVDTCPETGELEIYLEIAPSRSTQLKLVNSFRHLQTELNPDGTRKHPFIKLDYWSFYMHGRTVMKGALNTSLCTMRSCLDSHLNTLKKEKE